MSNNPSGCYSENDGWSRNTSYKATAGIYVKDGGSDQRVGSRDAEKSKKGHPGSWRLQPPNSCSTLREC